MKMNRQTILSYHNFNALSNDVIELAKEIMPDKVIYINFLNESVQVTMKVSKHNTNVNVKEGVTIPVEDAICNQIDYPSGKPLILENIRENNFNEKVNKTIEDSNIGSYLGIPISFKNGVRFGTLCAAHHDRSHFEEKDVALLTNIAKLFSFYLELEHIAYKDALTGLYNSHFLLNRQNDILSQGGLTIMVDLDRFKDVNDHFGHQKGDEVLIELGKKLSSFTYDFKEAYAFRLGGDEFFLYINESLTTAQIQELLESMLQSLRVWDTEIGNIPLSSSIGALIVHPNDYSDFNELLNRTDTLLYKAKHLGKNIYVLDDVVSPIN